MHPKPRQSAFELFLLAAPEQAVDDLLDSWTPDLVFRLRTLNTTFFLAVESYVGRAWAVEDVICRWFGESRSFLRTLEACGGVVSGSAALLHFSRGTFTPGDLDIYVPPWGLLRMGRYLKHHGFRYHSSGTKHPLFDVAAISLGSSFGKEAIDDGPLWSKISPFATFNFYRPRSAALEASGQDGTHIQVMVTRDDPVKFIVNSYHSSELSAILSSSPFSSCLYLAGVMNYFTSTYAVSLFPRSTFVDGHMYVCQDTTRMAATHRAWKAKYEARGYVVITAEDAVRMPPELLTWNRQVGDARTWVLPFKRSGKC